MPKVIITLEDKGNGFVSIECNPKMAEMAYIAINTINGISPAQGYAMCAMNAIHAEHKKMQASKSSGLIIKPN